MEEEEVHDYHYQNPSDFPRVSNDEMKPRVQDHRLASDHCVPANYDKCCIDIFVAAKLEELQQESCRVNRDAPRSNKQTPEIQSHASPEGGEDPEVDLKHVENGNGKESSYRHGNRERNIDSPTISLTG